MKSKIKFMLIISMMLTIVLGISFCKDKPDTNTDQYTLTINKTGNGTVTSNPDPTGGNYDEGTSVTLTAVADSGWSFDGWSGDLSGSNTTETITMDGNKTVTATFMKLDLKDEMVSVPGGTYTQQDTYGHSFSHTISDFSIGKYEVTYALWHTVITWAKENEYNFANAGIEGDDGTDGAEPTADKYEPVTTVNWRDAIVWCNAYSEMKGLTPVYKFNGNVLKDSRDSNGANCDKAEADSSANGYRLPTEGQWQYAASKTKDGYGPYNGVSGDTVAYDDSSNKCDDLAWYSDNSGNHTHPVGGKKANALDLYDMSGNVWEWCWDLYGDYPSDAQTDYVFPNAGSVRVGRGGSWSNGSEYLRVGYRNSFTPYYESSNLGFRVARCP